MIARRQQVLGALTVLERYRALLRAMALAAALRAKSQAEVVRRLT